MSVNFSTPAPYLRLFKRCLIGPYRSASRTAAALARPLTGADAGAGFTSRRRLFVCVDTESAVLDRPRGNW